LEGYGSIESQISEGESRAAAATAAAADPMAITRDTGILAGESVWKQLTGLEFWFMLVCSAIGILRSNLFIAMMPLLLDNMGDHVGHGDAYKQLFNYVLTCGFVFIPLINYCAKLTGILNTLQVTNAIGIAAFGLGLAPLLPIQILTFVVFTGFRAFLYAIVSAYNLQVFGVGTFGKIQGLMFTVGAAVNLLQAPLIDWAVMEYDGQMYPVCYAGVIMGILVFAFVEFARVLQRRGLLPPDEMLDGQAELVVASADDNANSSL